MYSVGDKVKVRRDLKSDMVTTYNHCFFDEDMKEIVEKNNYILTIKRVTSNDDEYEVEEDEDNNFWWTGEMFEGLVEEDTDKDKFKAWMTKLAEIKEEDRDLVEGQAFGAIDRVASQYAKGRHTSYNGLNNLEEDINILWNYVNNSNYDAREMTIEEIEAELGYKIKIKEN